MFYDKHQENIKDIHDNLGTFKINTTAAIINDFQLQKKIESIITCFVFAVYTKHRAEEGAISNSDIIKALPLRDFYSHKELNKMHYYGVVIGRAIAIGVAIVVLWISQIRVD